MTDHADINLKRLAANQCITLEECESVSQLSRVVITILEAERRSHLDAVDRIERALGITPRTSQIRRAAKIHS